MKIELDIRETESGRKYVRWNLYEGDEVQDSGVVTNQHLSVEDMILTAVGDIFHTTTRRF